MTDAKITAMKRLQAGLEAEGSGIEARLTSFPSGAAMLDVCRADRAFGMVYTPGHGFGVDELHPDDGFVTGYRFTFADFEPAAQQMRALALAELPVNAPPSPTLSLLVLHSGDVEAAKDFYSLLGLSFVEEQHGKGPVHYSAAAGPLVLEIYPCQGNNPSAPVRIGFRVPSLDQTVERVRSQGRRIIREAQDSAWGRRAVVEDPDGNRVELSSIEPLPIPQANK